MANTPTIAEAGAMLSELTAQALKDETARKELLALLREQVAMLESPLEVVWRMMMEPHQSAAMRTAMGMGLTDMLAASSGPMAAAELAEKSGHDRLLIVRILRPLSGMNVVSEIGIETYTATPLTKLLTVPSVGGGFNYMFDIAARAAIQTPQFLALTSYKNPEGPSNPFQTAFGTDKQMFPWLMEHPEHMSHFNDLMTGVTMNRTQWFQFANVDAILFKEQKASDEEGVLLVDIGGGRGHDVEVFQKSFPDAKGRLVLQDLPPVIDDIKELHSSIERMPHDFFSAQPIKGARAYYLRYILHDYSDRVCRKILSQIVSVMTPGYSKVLIHEWILPDTGAPLYPSLLDINMLALFAGMERTETQWRELLGSVGLEIVKIWSIDKNTEGLIEAVRKP